MEALIIGLILGIAGMFALKSKKTLDNGQNEVKAKDEALKQEQYTLKDALSDIDKGISTMKQEQSVKEDMTPEERASLSSKRFK